MTSYDFITDDVSKLAEGLASGAISAIDLTETMLARIARYDRYFNVYLHVDAEGARIAAAASAARFAAGNPLGPLDGIPFAAKDTIDIAGLPGTSGSGRHAGRIAPETAPAIQRLLDQGAVCLGKLNTWEYGTGNGGISYDLPFPPALNPRNITRFAAGSSTGAGAAVAAGLVVFAVGSDTGGSVRLPAASCGVVGLKPEVGAISTTGMMPNSASLDVVGPLTRSPSDAILLASVMSGTQVAAPKAGALKIGLVDFGMPVVDVLVEAVADATKTLADAGHTVVRCQLPVPPGDYRRITGIVNNGECARAHPGLSEDPRIGTALREKLWRGAAISDASLAAAQVAMADLRKQTDALFDEFDALLLPVTSILPPDIADPATTRLYTRNAFTHPFNLSGHPAMAVPLGLAEANLARSVQLVARDLSVIAGIADLLVASYPTPAADLDYPFEVAQTQDAINAEAAAAEASLSDLIGQSR